MSPRNSARAEQMRADASGRILRAALEVFGRRGFHEASTDEIARAAGVSKGLVFNYFRTKDELLEAILRQHLTDSVHVWIDDPPRGTAEERLREIFDRTMRHALERADTYRLYFSLLYQPGGSEVLARAVAAVKPELDQHYRTLTKIIRGHSPRDARARALLFQAGINGIFNFLLLQPGLASKPRVFPLKALREQLIRATLV